MHVVKVTKRVCVMKGIQHKGLLQKILMNLNITGVGVIQLETKQINTSLLLSTTTLTDIGTFLCMVNHWAPSARLVPYTQVLLNQF